MRSAVPRVPRCVICSKDAPTALAACCGFDLCHKYILYLYLYLKNAVMTRELCCAFDARLCSKYEVETQHVHVYFVFVFVFCICTSDILPASPMTF